MVISWPLIPSPLVYFIMKYNTRGKYATAVNLHFVYITAFFLGDLLGGTGAAGTFLISSSLFHWLLSPKGRTPFRSSETSWFSCEGPFLSRDKYSPLKYGMQPPLICYNPGMSKTMKMDCAVFVLFSTEPSVKALSPSLRRISVSCAIYRRKIEKTGAL